MIIEEKDKIEELQKQIDELKAIIAFIYNRSMTARVESYHSKRMFNSTADHNIKFVAELAGFALGKQPNFGALEKERFNVTKMIARELERA